MSFFHFIKMITASGFVGSFKDLIKLFIEGKVPYGPWPQHVDGYTSRKNVFIIHYEDLHTVKITKLAKI